MVLLGYAVAVAWLAPASLARLTANGVNARFALTAWLAAISSVVVSVLLAVSFLVRHTITSWPTFARTFCRSVTDGNCPPQVYRSALFELSLALAATIAALAAVIVAWRYGRSLRRARRQTRAHAEAARITGAPFPGHGMPPLATAVVLDAPQRAVYCVPGRPATIVLTKGALSVLDPAQFARGPRARSEPTSQTRHHLMIKAQQRADWRALPPFRCSPAAHRGVARLTECAPTTSPHATAAATRCSPPSWPWERAEHSPCHRHRWPPPTVLSPRASAAFSNHPGRRGGYPMG